MTKTDLLNAAKGKPVPFEGPDGFACLLRPLSFGERQEFFAWWKQHENDPGAGLDLQVKLVLAVVCDEAGAPLLERADLNAFAGPLADAIAKEAARRAGIDGGAGGDPKAA